MTVNTNHVAASGATVVFRAIRSRWTSLWNAGVHQVTLGVYGLVRGRRGVHRHPGRD